MTTIKNMLDNVMRLDLRSEVFNILENTKDEIIKLNQAQLYLNQIDKDGDAISPMYYSEEYETEKLSMNPHLTPGRVDLNYSGDFYSSFDLFINQHSFEVISSDSKAEELEYKYGEGIFGLTAENKSNYALTVFLDAMKSYIETTSGLKFN
jgi:hypothetical protein